MRDFAPEVGESDEATERRSGKGKGDGFIFRVRWRARDQTAGDLLPSLARPPAPPQLDARSDATFNFVGEPGAARQLTPLDRDPNDLPLAVRDRRHDPLSVRDLPLTARSAQLVKVAVSD